MSGTPITIVGMLSDGDTSKQVTIVGVAGIPGLEVGGGPIMPPGQPPVATPPIFYPPTPAHPIVLPPDPPSGGIPGVPTFPIWGPPGMELPPGSGYPPVAGHPLPPIGDGKPPQPIGGWSAKVFWTEKTGWGIVLVPGPGTEVPTPSR